MLVQSIVISMSTYLPKIIASILTVTPFGLVSEPREILNPALLILNKLLTAVANTSAALASPPKVFLVATNAPWATFKEPYAAVNAPLAAKQAVSQTALTVNL